MAHKDASKRDRSYKGSPDHSFSSVYSTEPDLVGFSVWTAWCLVCKQHLILFTLDNHVTNFFVSSVSAGNKGSLTHIHVIMKVYVIMDLLVVNACACGIAELELAALCAEQMEWRGILAAAPRVI